MEWSWLVGSYHEQIVQAGRQPLLLLLIGLIGSFLSIRTSARLIRADVRWWPGNVVAGGIHIHHEFVGVLMMLTTGVIAFGVSGVSSWRDLLALGFGIGAGLVLDEFALLLHLQDVYWSKQGRSSIDAVFAAVVLTGLLLVRAVPFGLEGISDDERSARWTLVLLVLVNFSLTLLVAGKGKPWVAGISVFSTAVGVWGACRLARPGSPWARRRYSPATMQRARQRSAAWDARQDHLISMIGGLSGDSAGASRRAEP